MHTCAQTIPNICRVEEQQSLFYNGPWPILEMQIGQRNLLPIGRSPYIHGCKKRIDSLTVGSALKLNHKHSWHDGFACCLLTSLGQTLSHMFHSMRSIPLLVGSLALVPSLAGSSIGMTPSIRAWCWLWIRLTIGRADITRCCVKSARPNDMTPGGGTKKCAQNAGASGSWSIAGEFSYYLGLILVLVSFCCTRSSSGYQLSWCSACLATWGVVESG